MELERALRADGQCHCLDGFGEKRILLVHASYSYCRRVVKNSCRGAAQDLALDTGLDFLKLSYDLLMIYMISSRISLW